MIDHTDVPNDYAFVKRSGHTTGDTLEETAENMGGTRITSIRVCRFDCHH